MGHQQTTNKEANNGYERPVLQVTQTTDGVTWGTAIGVAGAKTNKEPTTNKKDKTAQAPNRPGTKNFFRDIAWSRAGNANRL